ncbi:Cullin 3 [Fonsecaea monophora]|uniref:Cullin 3 n=1 Tax=Fonsecaea monophora TaxID=254056 RepID=A0A177EQV1_9EURO|nr:Cullin 3 [Fonsecaea monophora]OAG33831.1 Cullin 3 [Fonsecaea monophora]
MKERVKLYMNIMLPANLRIPSDELRGEVRDHAHEKKEEHEHQGNIMLKMTVNVIIDGHINKNELDDMIEVNGVNVERDTYVTRVMYINRVVNVYGMTGLPSYLGMLVGKYYFDIGGLYLPMHLYKRNITDDFEITISSGRSSSTG